MYGLDIPEENIFWILLGFACNVLNNYTELNHNDYPSMASHTSS